MSDYHQQNKGEFEKMQKNLVAIKGKVCAFPRNL